MNWIDVSYNVNQKYIVTESAILDAINNVFSEIKNSKLISVPRLSFAEDHSNVDVYLDVKISKIPKDSLYSCVAEIVKSVEQSIKLLIDKNPANVQICLVDN
ncbi:hypothetical protein NPA08_02860 [Mycoplasmopsis citelli]|uniref:MMB_0454 family protein n=1 Tax=Mycoplasmopsis citelli TaxID=171281 RepID=UPI0021139F49|nr:hypothetical protein [Mycoplasmopsis citelli]UUD35887.1 hypothetical protein NPA08_02860 [Mycoplasmopsis citelli]